MVCDTGLQIQNLSPTVPAQDVRSNDQIMPIGVLVLANELLVPIISSAFFTDTRLGSDKLCSSFVCETD